MWRRTLMLAGAGVASADDGGCGRSFAIWNLPKSGSHYLVQHPSRIVETRTCALFRPRHPRRSHGVARLRSG